MYTLEDSRLSHTSPIGTDYNSNLKSGECDSQNLPHAGEELTYKAACKESFFRRDKKRRSKKKPKQTGADKRALKAMLKKQFAQPHGLEDDYLCCHSGPGGDQVTGIPTPPPSSGEPSLPPIFESFEEGESSSDDDSTTSSTYEHEPAERDLRREERNNMVRAAVNAPPTLEADGSTELAALLESVSSTTSSLELEGCAEASQWISHLENLVILGYHINKANSITDIVFAVSAYIKMNTNKSVIQSILQMIDDVTRTPEKHDVAPNAFSASDVVQKWELFKTNTIFTKISYLITAAMSLTVCSVKDITWSPLGLQLISLEAAKTQLKALDVIDALIHTFSWVAETGYRVFQEGSLMPILYSDQKMQTFNEECDYILAHADAVLAGNGGEVQDFEFKVDKVLRQVSELKSVKDTGPTAVWLQARYSQLVEIKYKIVAKYRNTAIRFSPFGVGITGASGVGKSTLSKLTMKTSLHAMGFDVDPKRIITKDMFDKYDSTYTSDILGMYMDDVGNGKSAFAQTSPTDVIIKFFNNMAAQAVKAELNAKGVVFIAFKCGVLTSNFPDYKVREYTNKPEACLRRFVHARARVKPQYRIPGGISLNTNHPDLANCGLCHDVWEIDLEECFIFEDKEGKEKYEFRIMEVMLESGEKLTCKNLGLSDYLDAIIALARRHKINQTNVVNRSEEFDQMIMCDKCSRPTPMCKCGLAPHGVEVLGDIVIDAAKSSIKSYFDKWLNPISFLGEVCGYRPVKSMATSHLAKEMKHVINETATPALVSITPEWLFQTSVFQRSVALWQHSAAVYDLKKQMKFGTIIGSTCVGYGLATRSYKCTGVALGGTWLFTMAMWSQYRARIRHYSQEYLKRRDALPAHAKTIRDGYVTKGAFAISSIVVGLKLFQMWNKMRLQKEDITPDGNALCKESLESSPGWFGFMMGKLGVKVNTTESSKRASPSQIVSTLQKNNLFWAEFKRADGTTAACNIFFPRKCVAWFPEHIFYPKCDMTQQPTSLLTVTVFRHGDAGGKFSFKTQLDACTTTKDLDLVCAYVPNCPDLRDKLKWLPTSKPTGSQSCTMVVRDQGETATEKFIVEHKVTGHMYRDFYGGSYTSKLAKVGACMAPIVLEQKAPAIIGFHIGGNLPASYGVMQTVTLDQANDLISRLDKLPGVVLSTLATELPEEQYGIKLVASKDVHPNSMASKLDSDAYVDIIGSTRLRTVQKSRVVPSILSDAVADVTGVENKWGPPKLTPNWKGFNATLEHIVNPADMFAPSEVERVRQDWLEPLLLAMDEYVITEDFRPLTLKEMIMGIEGKRFLDPLKMDTGMGGPIFGPKHRQFTEVRDGEKLIDRVPSDAVLTELHRCEECWRRGERAYPLTTATLKDEATPVEKEKVRVFQAVAAAFGMWIRKYFLPIARFLSLHPTITESAVGVNAFSKQWEELMNHANQFAEDDKVIAWDYSKYDVRMNSQITRAVLISFIELAERGGYDADSLSMMRAMVNDIVHPLIDYNGTLLMAYNMNTSGNNITVNINSTAGSFYVRLGFFNSYPEANHFRSKVAAMTYGDDFKGSVKPGWRDFNFHSFQDYLAKHGMKITLPDKSEDSCAFMDEQDADFLKRKSHYVPEIATTIGALDEDSIFKSLHANLKSKAAMPEEVATSCIETAMHEWFAHGRAKYELRAKQMQEVCQRKHLLVPATYITYDERVEHWLAKYNS